MTKLSQPANHGKIKGKEEMIQYVMLLNAFTVEEVERRKHILMRLWRQIAPLVEREVQMPYDKFKELV